MDDTVASHRVITLLIQRLGLAAEAATPTAELAEDLGVDSVDAVAFALALLARFHAVRAFSRTIRSSEYHVTNACNIRCRGCWFFTFDFDKQTRDQPDLAALRAFIQRERARHINAALLIGGEPTLVPDR